MRFAQIQNCVKICVTSYSQAQYWVKTLKQSLKNYQNKKIIHIFGSFISLSLNLVRIDLDLRKKLHTSSYSVVDYQGSNHEKFYVRQNLHPLIEIGLTYLKI